MRPLLFAAVLAVVVFVRHHEVISDFTSLLGLGLLFCLMTLGWLSVYATVVARAGDALRRLGVRRALEAVTGLALLTLGAGLAFDRR